MLIDCPDPSEVTDFHFLQLRTLRIATKNKKVPEKSGNILTAASKYGLLFVGVEEGFNVIKLETVLTIDEDKENRSIVENYIYDFVPSGTPAILSVNANQTTLAVCVKCATNVVINLYSLSTYCGSGRAWQPFCTNALSPSGAEVRDFLWNPAIEGWYAVCFSDGSLQIHEVAGMSIKVIGTLQGANAVAVCWSPKGKQLVAGKEDGSFSQYKPNLMAVKTIPPPQLEESPVSVTSICWIANTLFAIVYVVGETPNLFIVSTPKDSPHVYTNFYDVCLGNNSAPHQRYLMHLEPSWGILVCASLDSIEIAVLGDMPNWVQWDLKEDGKALLPGKDGATHAVGMTVMYSAQRQLVISESEMYPPMPVLFVLTNNGLLVSFHMINSNLAAASLVSAPLPLESNAGNDVTPVAEASPLLLKQVPSTSNQPFMPSTFAKGNQASGDHTPVLQNREPANINVTQTFGKIESSPMPPVAQQKELSISSGDVKKPESVSFSQVEKSPAANFALPAVEKQNEVLPSPQNSYMTAIISEIQSFMKELQDLKQLQSSAPTIDGEEDMVSLKTYALNLHNFQKNIVETMQSISSDIYTLKNVLLESFAMVEEAYSRVRRRNDHSYLTMLKERALDPITAKHMRKMNQHYQYLNTQMRELSDKLDQDWVHLCTDKGRRSLKGNLCISPTEAIYKTIVNNQHIIHNLKKKVETLVKKSEERKPWNTTSFWNWRRSRQDDLSQLADAFLQMKTHPEEGEPTVTTKKLSSESQTVLREYLRRSNVVAVRPTAVYYPSQSRLLSNAAPSEDFSGSDHGLKKDVTPKQITPPDYPAGEKEVPDIVSSPGDAQTPKVATKLSFSVERTPNHQSTPKAPVYEAITPPDAMNATVPVDKTFSSNNVPGSSMTSEKLFEQPVYHPPLFKATNSLESSAKSCTDQETGSNVLSSSNSNVENLSNASCPVRGKPLAFNQTPSENVPSASTLLFFPKALSFASSKTTDIAAPNPLTVSNSALVSSAATSFQFTSSSGPKKDVFSAVPTISSVASSTKISSQLETKNIPESPQCIQPETSLAQLSTNTMNLPVSSSTDYILPVAKISQVSSPPLFTQPENTNSTLFTNKNPSGTSFEKGNVGFFFQKISDNGNKSDISTLKTDTVSVSSPSAAAKEISVLKTDTVDSLKSQLSDVEKTIPAYLASTSPGPQTSFATIQKNESAVISSSQPTTTDTFFSFSELKQLIPSPETSVSEPSVVPAVVTSAPVSEIAQSTVPLPVSSADMSKSPPVTSTVSVISQPDVSVSKSPTPPGPILSPVTTATAPATTMFEQTAAVTTTTSSGTDANAPASTTESSSVPAFGVKTAPVFGQSTAETSSFFGAANAFSQTPVSQSSPFGQTASNSSFPSASGGFFSQVPSFGSPAAPTTTSSSDFSNQMSTFSFGKPAFGQASGSFGLAKSFFGQNTTPVTQAAASPSSFSFAQNSNNVFGQGSFFSGLGGKPSEENASKNVFGQSNNIKLNSDGNNLFKNSSVTSFGSVNSGPFSSTGSFSSGGGSVAQAGFGAFQQNTSSPQSAGFGTAPSFGGAPSFGSPPAFGTPPTFGSGNALSSSVFSQQQVISNFSNFANASSPTFGSLASQSPPAFGGSSPAVSGFGSQGAGFASSPVFGGGSSFGGQSSSFGSPSSPASNSSAFTQWRN